MLTIQKWLEGVGRNRQPVSECPSWPPDLFAICASLLKRSGSYLRVFERGPGCSDWRGARGPGVRWRQNIDAHRTVTAVNLKRAVPREVLGDWATLIKSADRGVCDIGGDPKLSDALIRLAVVADAASDGIGIGTNPTPFFAAAQAFLDENDSTSFAWDVPRDSLCVLGKQHTPQRGATLRSLSHHLALYLPNDITARWIGQYPQIVAADDGETLNLLLLPWPERIDSGDFRPARPVSTVKSKELWFEYSPVTPMRLQTFKQRLKQAIRIAARNARRIDAVVFPELALSIEEYRVASQIAVQHGIMLISGVRIPGSRRELDINACVVQAAGNAFATVSYGNEMELTRPDLRALPNPL